MTEDTPQPAPAPATQPRNPLHGVTLETMVTELADYFGWQGLGMKRYRPSTFSRAQRGLQPEVFAQNTLGA